MSGGVIVGMPLCLNALRPECPKPSRNAPIAKSQCPNHEVAMLQPRSRNTPLLASAADVGSLDNDEVQPEQLQVYFEVELAWCIQQLELALHTDVSARQGAEAVKVLKVLKNPKAALVKKRHAMRTTFGDYRKKMQEEEKMFASSDAVSQPMTSERASVTYGRPVTSRLTPEEVPSESTAQMEKAQQFVNNKAACFKFNFSVSNAVTEVLTDCSANGSGINAGDSGASASAGVEHWPSVVFVPFVKSALRLMGSY
ncbi:hypothetical protein NP493_417g02047 [Ridgeia piscesae]|uniref:Uncharacterized protein n=1 Tax=Ridgeia piscesae TaxID=27915 RepID=A0AAD9L0Z6_RIDPI|nr:hypothetical protein NP493_417g02047 [Ridgeia piscesae]